MSTVVSPTRRSSIDRLRAECIAMDIQEEEWVMATQEMADEDDRQNLQLNHQKRAKMAVSYV